MRATIPSDRPGDPELWQLARDGDGSAFGQLFDRHATAVYNHLFRRTANWSEAEDRSLQVQVSTGTGAIWLRLLAGRADATADVGNVHGQGLAGRQVDLRTGVGYVSAAFASAPARLEARAETGSVTLSVPAGTSYAVRATASLGAVSIDVPRSASAAHVIQASADVGSVMITAR